MAFRKVKARGRGQHTRGVMNKTEARFADYCKLWLAAGKIVRWDFEPEKLKLAEGAYFTPDFRVQLADGTIEFHEVKAPKKNTATYRCEEAAKVRIRVAADVHPLYAFCIRWEDGRGGWHREDF